MKQICLLAFGLAVLAIPASAQVASGTGTEVRAGLTVGAGDGPSPLGRVAGSVLVAPSRYWGVQAGLGLWRGGMGGACVQSWPGSYRCEARGGSGRVGLMVTPVRLGPVEPFAEAGTGVHFRKGATSPLVSAALGARIRLGGRAALRLEGARMWVLDQDYEDLLGEGLRLTTFGVGLDLLVSSPRFDG